MSRLIHGCDACPEIAKGTHSLDEMLGASGRAAASRLDLTHLVREVPDQGPVGTCVGFGTKRAIETCARQGAFADFKDVSAMQLYKQSRKILGNFDDFNDGSTVDASLTGVRRGGFLYDEEMPYRPIQRFESFKLGAAQTALRRAGVKTHRFSEKPGPALKEAIQVAKCSGKGLVGGWMVGAGFEKWNPASGPFDGKDWGVKIGHCMSPIDYPNGLPRVVNSWGEHVGDRGIWTVTWEWLMGAQSLWAVDFVPQD